MCICKLYFFTLKRKEKIILLNLRCNFFRSARAFQELLYVNPDFQRAKEVRIRLGFIFKVIGDFEKALKHYNLALLDQTSCSFSNQESELKENNSD